MVIVEKEISELIQAEYNPRKLSKNQYNQLKDSLNRFGVVDPVLVNMNEERKNIIIGGHQRTKVWNDLGNTKIPCIELDLSLDKEKELNVRLNKNTGEFDFELLEDYFSSSDLIEWGFEESELEFFGDDIENEIDDNYEIPNEIKTDIVLGDLIEINNHRLMCGDSTNPEDIEKLMGGCIPDLIHTDPPYGMNAVSKSGVLKKTYGEDINGDDNNDIAKDSFNLIHSLYSDTKQVWWGANYYSTVLPDSESWVVWDKNNGGSDQTDCELAWANFRSVVRQFTQASEKTNRVHPTQKPVSLLIWIIKQYKLTPATIADFFGGSGMTMVASHQIGAASYLMENDPKFCQVIINRMKESFPNLEIRINGDDYKVSE